MFKKTFTCVLLLVAQGAFAQAQFLEDGCSVLANVIQRSVAIGPKTAQRPRTVGEFGIYRCSSTAATVTESFANAMREMRISMRWVSPGIPPGDICLSHDIDQCYPRGNMLSDPTLPWRYEFMRDRWTAVQRSLRLTIQRNLQPDLSVFQVGTFEQSVRSQLGTATRLASGDWSR